MDFMSDGITKSMMKTINKIMKDPDRERLLKELMEKMADVYVKNPQDGDNPSPDPQVKPENDMQPFVPDELLDQIASNLEDAGDVANMRLVNKRFARATAGTFVRSLAWDRTIYPRYDSLARFLAFLVRFPAMKFHVHDLTLVAEGMKVHEYGYEWAWEDLQNWEDVDFDATDIQCITMINCAHAYDMWKNGSFITAGGYRTMLGLVFAHCPNLRSIVVRKLKPDEHLPGWCEPVFFEQLSFYRPGLAFNGIFYGDWQYDTLHLRVTQHKDEFGDTISEDGAGPQASFRDDLKAALDNNGLKNKVKVIMEKA